jgi:hypothetical protein
VAHFAQLCAETGSETHIVESWRQPPPEHQHKGVLPHSQTKADVAGTACRTGGTAAGGL